MVVKAEYLFSLHLDNNWYWNKHPQQHVITVTTHTILHPRLEVISVKYFHAILKRLCNRTQAQKYISRNPIRLTDSDYNCILEEIVRRK